MSASESQLKRVLKKEELLNKKLSPLRKKRDQLAKQITRITKKKKPTKTDTTTLRRKQNNLIEIESDITKLLSDLEANTRKINKYREKVEKEKQKETDKLMKQIRNQSRSNKEYVETYDEISKEISRATEVLRKSSRKNVKYDLFLSHSSLDKDPFVNELSIKFEELGLEIFFDTSIFKIGDSQIDQMSNGIMNSKAVVLFISKNFFNSGWATHEMRAFLNRHVKDESLAILPIWHEVTAEEVEVFNIFLADKFALKTSENSIEEIARMIYEAITNTD